MNLYRAALEERAVIHRYITVALFDVTSVKRSRFPGVLIIFGAWRRHEATTSRRFPRVQRAVLVRGSLGVLLCLAGLGFAVALARWVDFPEDTSDRLAFALRADLFIVIWVIIAIRRVSSIRDRSIEDSAGAAYAPPSERLALRAAFLRNTLEQAFIAVIGHLALASVEGDAALAFVVIAVVLFGVGRVAFIAGYPHGAGGPSGW